MLNVITTLAALQALLALTGAIVYFTTTPDKKLPFLALGVLLTIAAGVDIASFVLFFGFKLGSNWLQNIYNLTETVLIIVFFRNLTGAGKRFLNVFNIAIIIFLAFAITNLISFQGLYTINSYTKAAGSFLIIIFCLMYFYFLIQNLPAQKLSALPSFWITTGLLIYSAGAFIVFIFTDYLINVMKDNLIYYWAFHNFLVNTEQVLILIGLWKNKQTHNSA